MGPRIKMVRENLELSQAAFGEKLGVSQNYVWMLEHGQRVPSKRAIRDICRVFGVNEMWLRTGVGEPFAPKTRAEELAEIFENVEIGNNEKARLIRAMARMPDEAFPAFVEFLEQLHKSLTEE